MADVEYDQKGQYEQILPWILENERLYAVYDCKGAGTGFLGITNKRIVFYDKAFMRKRKALVSVPFSKITSVGSVDEGRGLWGATSELVIKTGSEEFEFEFRGGDKAQRAYRFIMSELLQNEKA
ncbi:MAG: PH domain-containing protein [Chloroflexi bacterium]|nr:PH domain-containing protein [Chloroflexota bacterium]